MYIGTLTDDWNAMMNFQKATRQNLWSHHNKEIHQCVYHFNIIVHHFVHLSTEIMKK